MKSALIFLKTTLRKIGNPFPDHHRNYVSLYICTRSKWDVKCCLASLGCNQDRLPWQQKRRIHSQGKEQQEHAPSSRVSQLAPAVIATIAGGSLVGYLWLSKSKLQQSAVHHAVSADIAIPGNEILGLPIYTADEIADHNEMNKGVWVSYKSGVYDITRFVGKHPGGDKILMAAGGSLEPFWEMYAVHKTEQVLKIMEEYRIGNLALSDRGEALKNMDDPFANEPHRHPALKPASVKPFNAEPPLALLVDKFFTPNALFYVRNHLPVPVVDANEYELEISGHGVKTTVLSLNDIKTKFPKVTVAVTIQCAGNRRSDLHQVKEVKGLYWGAAAIGTATWSGARLVDVLKYAKANLQDPRIQHVEFEGLDTDPANMPYGASVPSDKALDPKSEVILAYEMNGEELSRDHGYPIRAIVPGVVGARNVKWLGRIILSQEESHSHWQRGDYKGFSPSVDWDTVDFDSAPAIQELPVTSVICDPPDSSPVKVQDGLIKARGYAWSGGGRKIVRVDVSADEGKTWTTAKLQQEATPLWRTWSWTLWDVAVPLPQGTRSGTEVHLMCKAVDSSYNVQPESSVPIWNLRGVLANAWHKVKVKVQT